MRASTSLVVIQKRGSISLIFPPDSPFLSLAPEPVSLLSEKRIRLQSTKVNASVAGDEDERRPRFIVRVGKLLARAERIEFLPSSRFVNLESGEREGGERRNQSDDDIARRVICALCLQRLNEFVQR